jgi:hypothetical protein
VAAPAHAGSAVTALTNSTTPKTVATGTRAVGDLVVVVVAQNGSDGASTWAVSDNLGNTYTRAERRQQGGRWVELWYSVLTAGGALTVTVTSTAGTGWGAVACWATPASGSAIEFDTSSGQSNASGTSHFCGSSGQIDTAADVLVYAATSTTGAAGATTDPSGFTRRQSVLTDRAYVWSRESTAAVTDERGGWAATNTIQTAGAIASFKTVAGGGSIVPQAAYYLAQMGA